METTWSCYQGIRHLDIKDNCWDLWRIRRDSRGIPYYQAACGLQHPEDKPQDLAEKIKQKSLPACPDCQRIVIAWSLGE